MDNKKLYHNHLSLSEWLKESSNQLDVEKFVIEDNTKRNRLEILNNLIGLPFDKPIGVFNLVEVIENSNAFQGWYEIHYNRPCALRLTSKLTTLPKLRIRGNSVEFAVKEWLIEQDIDPKNYQHYRATFIPHSPNNLFSSIIVVDDTEIYGEAIEGDHHQLTNGKAVKEGRFPVSFKYIASKEELLIEGDYEEGLKEHLESVLKWISVRDVVSRRCVEEKVKAEFNQSFIVGYWEAVETIKHGTWFIDYNRILPALLKEGKGQTEGINIENSLKKTFNAFGRIASNGSAMGKLIYLTDDEINDIDPNTIDYDFILMCKMTSPKYLPLMIKSKAVLTEIGGILSHASITCRELSIPCVVNCRIDLKSIHKEVGFLDTYTHQLTIINEDN